MTAPSACGDAMVVRADVNLASACRSSGRGSGRHSESLGRLLVEFGDDPLRSFGEPQRKLKIKGRHDG